MKKKLIAVLLAALLMTTLIPVSSLAEMMYITSSSGSSVRLREGPGTDYDAVTTIGFGELVNVIDYLAGSEWVNVEYDGYYGYVRWSNLTDDYPIPDPVPAPTAEPTYGPIPTAKPTNKPTAKPTGKATAKPTGNNNSTDTTGTVFEGFEPAGYVAVVTPSKADGYVHMRWAPTLKQPIFGDYYANTELYVLYQSSSWCQVYDPATNFCGYMAREFLAYVRPMDGAIGGGDGSSGGGNG